LSVYSSVALVAILVACFVTIFASEILNLLFGKDYLGGVDVLKIRIWETVFAAIGVITGSWALVEGMQRQTLIFSVFGMLINISLNLILIPLFGIKGAAISSLVSIIFVVIILPLCFKDMRNDVYRRILALSLWPLILYTLKKYQSR
jgi:O-antigen/teichoic acid export membrane protein